MALDEAGANDYIGASLLGQVETHPLRQSNR
jgi:hypothetical protein